MHWVKQANISILGFTSINATMLSVYIVIPEHCMRGVSEYVLCSYYHHKGKILLLNWFSQ